MDLEHVENEKGEEELAQRDPIGYARNVDGDGLRYWDTYENGKRTRHLTVWDKNIELRYLWENGQLVKLKEGVF